MPFPSDSAQEQECLLYVKGRIKKCLPHLTHPPEALYIIISSFKINWKNTTENLYKYMLNPPERQGLKENSAHF